MSEEKILFESRASLEKALPPYEIKKLKIDTVELCIYRTGEEVFLFEPKCPHMDYPLERGHINPQLELVCAWHGYRFNLHYGDETDNRCRSLKLYKTYWNDSGQLVLQDTL